MIRRIKKDFFIMLVDDSPEDRAMVRSNLRVGSNQHFTYVECGSGVEAIAKLGELQNNMPDCMIIDMNMPEMDGIATLQQLRESQGYIPLPIILLTGSSGDEERDLQEAHNAISHGAQDYITKSTLQPEMISRVIYNAIERFNLQNALRLQADQYRLAIEASGLGAWSYEPYSKQFSCSERIREIAGFDPLAELLLENFLSMVHPDDAPRIDVLIRSTLEKSPPSHFWADFRIILANGDMRLLNTRGKTNIDRDGHVQLYGTMLDITERKRVQDERERFFNIGAELRAVIDFEERFVSVNPKWAAVLGWEEHELLNKPWTDFVHPEDKEQALAVDEDVRAGGEVRRHENRYRHKNGHYVWLSWKAQPFPEERLIYASASDISERKKLMEERDRFFNVALDIMVIGNFDGKIIKMNSAFTSTLGWSENEVLHKPWLDFIHPDDMEETLEVTREITQRNMTWTIDQRYKCKDGTYRWINWRGESFVNEGLLYCTGHDITSRKESEEKLRSSELQFRQLANAMPQVVWTTRPDGYMNYVNERCTEYSGRLLIEDGIIDWTPIVHPDDLPTTRMLWSRSIETGTPYEVNQRIFHKESGQYRWNLSRALPVRNDEGEIIRWYVTNTDIEDQKRAEEIYRNNEQFTQSIIDSSPDCIKILDIEGRLLSMNEKGCIQMEVDDFTVCMNKEWIGFWEGVEREQALHSLNEAREGRTSRFEGYCPTMKGTKKWWEVIVTPVRNGSGEISEILSVSRDITERKKLEGTTQEALERAEAANIAKTEFLANMSHEIRTPMNAVIGLSNILAMSQPLTPKQKEFIHTLQLSADSLLSLINDLLDISKIESRTVELESIPFNINEMLQHIISIMAMKAREKNLEFEMQHELDNKLSYIGDPTRLKQILLNLCSNALKFTDTGGVYINVQCTPLDEPGQDNVCISVRDTGIGIAHDKLDTIFHKFTQADSSINRKYGGTGLGLAITKTLTEIMGGTIVVTSDAGKGSTFTICIPMQRVDSHSASTASAAVAPEADAARISGPKVLLVEDYPANILVATSFLDLFGYRYDVATNGEEAVERVKSGEYGVVLMDVQMRGMNGLEATQIIRSFEASTSLPAIPIIGMTAHALMGDRERVISAGMNDYITKPFNPDELQEKLELYTKQKATA